MITLTIILTLIFVPPARRIALHILSSLFGALGIVFLVSRDSSHTRRQ